MENIISKSEELLIEIIFGNNKQITTKITDKIINDLVRLSSKNLLLPLVYSKLKSRNLLELFPKEFQKYLEEIFLLNFKRNKSAIEEIIFLKTLFKKHNINFQFFKGAKLLSMGFYNNIGERMMGDIDIIIEKKDYDKAFSILKKQNYENSWPYFKTRKVRHGPRMIHKNKLFAIELHNELLRYEKKNIFKGNTYLNSNYKFIIKDIDICILSCMVNDYSNLYAKYNYKVINDVLMILSKTKNYKPDFNVKYIKRFFIITNYLGFTKFKIQKNLLDYFFIFRIKLKKSSKFYFEIDNFICDLIKNLSIIPSQLIEVVINKDYQKFICKKLKVNNP